VSLPVSRLESVRLMSEFGCQDVILSTEKLAATAPLG
jgi:hypothetical protein